MAKKGQNIIRDICTWSEPPDTHDDTTPVQFFELFYKRIIVNNYH